MESTKNDTTIQEAELSLKKQCKEWVDEELATGIEIPVRYWKGGHYKQLLFLTMYKIPIIPYIVGMIFVLAVLIEDAKAALITGGILASYIVLGILIHRRHKLHFMLSQESITVISGPKKTVIPWKKVKNISHVSRAMDTGLRKRGALYEPTKGATYEIIIQTDRKYYHYYEEYTRPHDLLFDRHEKINLPALPLHILYTVLQAAREKVKELDD